MFRLRSTLLALFALAFLCGIATPAPFGEMKGQVKEVNANTREFFVTDKEFREWKFELVKDGKVFLDDKEVELSNVKPGHDARVEYTVVDNKNMATEVRARNVSKKQVVVIAPQQIANVRGEIKEVTLNRNEFLLRDDDAKEWRFELDRDGKVFIDGQEASLSDLTKGDKATVKFTEKEDLRIAHEIRCKRIEK